MSPENAPVEKKQRGRKPKKPCKVTQAPLQWPEGMPRTPSNERERGDFHLKRKNKDVAKLALAGLQKVLTDVGAEHAKVTFNFGSEEEASDEAFNSPEIAVWYGWRGKDNLMLACDTFTTAVANIRAVTHTLSGFATATKYSKVFSDFGLALREFQPASENDIAPRKMVVKAPIKTHLDPYRDWPQILEIVDGQRDIETGLPFDHFLPIRQKRKMEALYHPDAATDPDKGQSFCTVGQAFECVIAQIKEHVAKNEKAQKSIPTGEPVRSVKVTSPTESIFTPSVTQPLSHDKEPTNEELDQVEREELEADDDRDFDQRTYADDDVSGPSILDSTLTEEESVEAESTHKRHVEHRQQQEEEFPF